MNIRKTFRGIFALFLTLIIVSASLLPCLAVDYPANVSKDQAYVTITKADKLIVGFTEGQNASLKETVLKEIYSDETLSMILTEIYKALESEAGETLSSAGVDTSVSGIAEKLSDYPSVAKKLSAYSFWSEVNLSGAEWGVKNKGDFSAAVASMLSPFNDLLYALLCSGSYSPVILIGIKGSNGYETAIIPTFEAMGFRGYLDAESFYAQAKKDKGTMIYNIAYDLVSYAEKILDAPFDNLTSCLPSIAHYLLNGGFDSAVANLMSPLRLQVLNIATLIPIESFASFLNDTQSFTQDFTLNINDMLSQTGVPMAPVDLQLLASLGTVNEDGSVTADKADTFIVLLRWLIDTLKMNQTSAAELLPQTDAQTQQIIFTILGKETDSLISILVSLLNQSGAIINENQWAFPAFTSGQAAYTPNLNAEKYQRVADGVDELLDQIVAEMGEEKSLGAVLKKEIYSSKTLSILLKTLFGAFEGEELSAVTALLGVDISPKGIAAVLRSKGFGEAADNLSAYTKWSAIGENGVDLGIKRGSQTQFISLVASVMSPFEDLLGMLLAEDKIVLFDAVDFYGSNGYNTAIIPIYEALGCEDSTVRTHEEFKALYGRGKGVEALLDPIVSLLDRFTEKPVYTLLQILPNMLYFLESGGFNVCIQNLIYPFTALLSQFGIEYSIDLSQLGEINADEIMKELMASADMDITLPEIDMAYLASLGTAVEKTSKRTVGGQYATVTYIQSDMPALCVTILRTLAETVKSPDNSGLIQSLMDTGMGSAGGEALPEGSEELAEAFMQSVINDINAMSVDETTEWLYRLFFRERAVAVYADEEDYMPTIIYKEPTDYSFVLIILFCLMLIPVSIIIRNKIRLRRMKEYSSESSQEV